MKFTFHPSLLNKIKQSVMKKKTLHSKKQFIFSEVRGRGKERKRYRKDRGQEADGKKGSR